MKKLLSPLLIFPLIIGCPVAYELDKNVEAFPLEEVSCTHPDSQYEAVVEIRVEDKTEWVNLEFYIYQESNEWDTNLYNTEENPRIYETRMQLYELNCLEEYDYNIDYIN